ncbi:unnamed protein product, partial [Timema podura]|nr:unnamed protein product [Timema podura]
MASSISKHRYHPIPRTSLVASVSSVSLVAPSLVPRAALTPALGLVTQTHVPLAVKWCDCLATALSIKNMSGVASGCWPIRVSELTCRAVVTNAPGITRVVTVVELHVILGTAPIQSFVTRRSKYTARAVDCGKSSRVMLCGLDKPPWTATSSANRRKKRRI